MKVKFMITTPKGHAKVTSDKLKMFLARGVKLESHINDEDSKIVWIYEGDSRHASALQTKIMQFQKLMLMTLKNPVVNGIVNRSIKQEEKKQLYDMLENKTKIIILKQATAEELINDKNFFTRIKERLF